MRFSTMRLTKVHNSLSKGHTTKTKVKNCGSSVMNPLKPPIRFTTRQHKKGNEVIVKGRMGQEDTCPSLEGHLAIMRERERNSEKGQETIRE